MSVNVNAHKVVVLVTGADDAFGFTSLSEAVNFIEQQYTGQDYAKVYNEIILSLGVAAGEESDLKVMDIDTYIDLFVDEDEDVIG